MPKQPATCAHILSDLSECGSPAQESHPCCDQWICDEHYDYHTDYCYCETCG